ncbi:hypothetical protein [Ruminococcus albus]|uniref:Uncharacterized protein n=1 Tax=Ruminococcus albus 8 TaxID=246199 RepID=E9SC99_RUMAL|nr:hypothetical protein [Ruminococcus albus]EGC03097.1 hypothetical protein CUS_4485 [Ruminococcus albus 8]MCC3351887.1 hypothetical protein [Ruminococcus albus 8]
MADCKYCKGGSVMLGKTTDTKLFIDTGTEGKSRTLVTECTPCPDNANCGLRGVPARAAFLINYCPMCGRNLRTKTSETKTTEIKAGEHFTYKGIDFVCLEVFDKEVYGRRAALAVTAKIIKSMEFAEKFEDGCNDWRRSKVREWLNDEFLAMHIAKEDVLPQISDLVADNGDNAYGTSEDLVTLLSYDQYRKYRKLMPKFNGWVWTVTPLYPHTGNAHSVRAINPSGELSYSITAYSLGVAPVCLFDLDELNLTNK